MVSCTFCGSDIRKGSGKIYVRDNGQVLNFCSSKCEKNMLKLGRDNRKFKWTTSFVKGEVPKASEAKASSDKKAKAAKPTTKKVAEKKTESKK